MNTDSLKDSLRLHKYARAHKLARQPVHLLLILAGAEVMTMHTAALALVVNYEAMYNPVLRLHTAGLINIHRSKSAKGQILGLSLTPQARLDLSQIFPEPKPQLLTA
jgi:hypothetical protein